MSEAVRHIRRFWIDRIALRASIVLRAIYSGFARRYRQRAAANALQQLSDYELKDIGGARCEIDYKVEHPQKKSNRRPDRDDAGRDPR